ncbi:hypothetical protein C9J85_07490 [Haloferax sp. wsp5]|nr:hypothetical protein C9J85_07490 [Haloferax sp. wsp5]
MSTGTVATFEDSLERLEVGWTHASDVLDSSSAYGKSSTSEYISIYTYSGFFYIKVSPLINILHAIR